MLGGAKGVDLKSKCPKRKEYVDSLGLLCVALRNFNVILHYSTSVHHLLNRKLGLNIANTALYGI